jgi:hypothetical protein
MHANEVKCLLFIPLHNALESTFVHTLARASCGNKSLLHSELNEFATLAELDHLREHMGRCVHFVCHVLVSCFIFTRQALVVCSSSPCFGAHHRNSILWRQQSGLLLSELHEFAIRCTSTPAELDRARGLMGKVCYKRQFQTKARNSYWQA